MTRKEAQEEMIKKLEAGVKYETAGHTIICAKAFPKSDNFGGSREAYARSAAQQAILAWRNNSLDAAKELHEAVLPGWDYGYDGSIAWVQRPGLGSIYRHDDMNGYTSRAWLIAILKALHAQEDD